MHNIDRPSLSLYLTLFIIAGKVNERGYILCRNNDRYLLRLGVTLRSSDDISIALHEQTRDLNGVQLLEGMSNSSIHLHTHARSHTANSVIMIHPRSSTSISRASSLHPYPHLSTHTNPYPPTSIHIHTHPSTFINIHDINSSMLMTSI
jgi:hypothetical protein